MPVARTLSITLVGVEGHPVLIEADIENGLPGLLLVGLPDTALREARDRIRAAIVNSGEKWPPRRITVGLSPASLPKRGSGFDLGIALAILAASGAVPADAIEGVTFLGELGLDGQLRPVRGVLPAVAAAAAAGCERVAVADANAAEAALVPGLRVVGAPSLAGAGRDCAAGRERPPGLWPARRGRAAGAGHRGRRQAGARRRRRRAGRDRAAGPG
jgi:magnesium chelatase family protein